MRKVVLDTETTGLEPKLGHRIIEIAAIELDGRKVSQRRFHRYLNPEREIDAGAAAVHGLTLERLQNEPKFADIVHSFLEFISGAELLIHNAPFDIGFINHELALLKLPPLNNPVTDTLKLAREMYPGKKNSLDALCSRLSIDNSHRTLHGALLDTELLGDVYLAMTRGQDSLLIDEEEPVVAAAATQQQDQPMQRVTLKVLAPTDSELAAHGQQLVDIDKASKGACVWKKLEESVAVSV